ncbi:hypothetical protein [Chryseobacterium sp.]|uniref:hypothetical protein n=1 Tax=Chryseobacterium sp. TaxID=1871047 RepID=UPI0024E26861|nr:hypothetical protein [Chryseobacterium sp.]
MRETTKMYVGGSKTKIVRGEYTIKSDGNHSMWVTKGNIIVTAEKQITQQGEKTGVSHGNYVPPEEIYTTHPKVEKVEFLDENNKLLNQNTKDFFYGQKLKIKVSTSNAKGKSIYVDLQGKTKSINQKFDILNTKRFSWNGLVTHEEVFETQLFVLNPNWYSDDFEEYDYNVHETKIKEEDLNEFFAKVILDAKNVFLPQTGNRLRPISYKRNYEELIGLFKTDDSGVKDLLTNYENFYIDKYAGENEDIKDIVDDFSEWLCEDHTEASIEEINAKVSESAGKLWDYAVLQHQDHSMKLTTTNNKTGVKKEEIKERKAILDDRPLYWARIAMQVILKRQYVFIKEIKALSQKDQEDFFKKSIIPKSSKLWKTIVLFEEKSRNYTGIDFSKADNKKKILITGFDPFVLNPQKDGNILQSNPSGINALTLYNKIIGNYFIQTFICPVRYADFDRFKNDKGLIEYLIEPLIKNVDMIITVSQGDVFRFDVDRFPCKNRGGFADNMYWGNSSESYNEKYFNQLNEGKEFYETTLPYKKIVPNKNNITDVFWIYLNQTYNSYHGGDNDKTTEGVILRSKLLDLQKQKSYEGSGGDYLSNEIFYRVAKLRTELYSTLPTGHLHIPLTQFGSDIPAPRGNIVTRDINPKINILIEEIKNIIIKI